MTRVTPALEKIAREVAAKCAVSGCVLERDGCSLRITAGNIALKVDMDAEPVPAATAGKKRCDFAVFQRLNPHNNRAHLVLIEFKAKLHEVNDALRQLAGSLEFFNSLSECAEFAFDFHASALVCREEVGRQKLRQLENRKVPCGGVSMRFRPMILVSGRDKLTDEGIAEHGQPRPKRSGLRRAGAKKRG